MLPLASVSKRTPGAKSAADRKLRVACGMASIILLETVVPTCESMTPWRCALPWMTTVPSWLVLLERSSVALWPTDSVTSLPLVAPPTRSS